MAVLDGPRVAPAAGGPARQLVIFLHGYGANGDDLIRIADHWAARLPHAAFVAPDAPEPCGPAPGQRQWFALQRIDPTEINRGVREAGPVLDRFIDDELARHGLDDRALALVGFSQGTMVGLHVGLRRRAQPATLIGYSGAVGAPDDLAREITVRPPVLLVHGDADPVVPIDALYLSIATLAGVEVPVEWHVRRGLGHNIDPESIAIGGDVLTCAFGRLAA